MPQTHAVVNVHVPCRVCYPWIEHIFKVTDLPPEVGAGATVCVCLSVDDWALDRMSKYNIMTDEVKSKNCEKGKKYIYKLSRMIPADRPVTFCFAAFIDERERGNYSAGKKPTITHQTRLLVQRRLKNQACAAAILLLASAIDK